jgi:hypothetical protein
MQTIRQAHHNLDLTPRLESERTSHSITRKENEMAQYAEKVQWFSMSNNLKWTACSLLLLSGCSRSKIIVELPPNFKGHVAVTCEHVGEVSSPVIIDPEGSGTAPLCPSRAVHLDVRRAGHHIEIGDVSWSRTGDNIPVGFRLVVK